jgi:mannose-6-phosphate isomerase-like protein (cupin superfamily)
MPVATLSGAPVFEREGFVFRPLAVPSRGSTELALWALEVAPGAASETHSVDREEVFVVNFGTVSASIDGADNGVADGDALIVPAGVPFRLRNPGPDVARLTVITSAGMRGTVDGVTFDPPWAQ